MIRKIALSTAAASLALAPVAAQAVDAERSAAPVTNAQGMAGGAGIPVILTLLAGIGIILAVTSSNEDDEEPLSP